MSTMGRLFGRAALMVPAMLFVLPLGQAMAQMLPLEIPFLDEWAALPHARITAESFNHWNKEGMIRPACAKCHSTYGFRDFLGADGSTPGKVDKPALAGSVIGCIACHNPPTVKLTSVTFPSGQTVKDLGDEAICMNCHQGRAHTGTVDEAVKGIEADTVSAKLKFINIHYRAAAATRYGTEARGGYEYAGKTYRGYDPHDDGAGTCSDCHNRHTVQVEVASCNLCHRSVKTKKDYRNVRRLKGDFDGDGDVKEGIAKEIDTLHGGLLTAIEDYAKKITKPIGYDSHQYPYFFADKNGNGKIDPAEANYGNRYKSWTPRLLKAAYNYQYLAKDPGAYSHNSGYVIQLLHDSLADLSEKVPVKLAGKARPE
ncbi:MAG: cytochrome c3 family protein [Rhodospirillales bacterium]|jgi:hypothetical protein|nr:cytochrome c3 family protein [Rhodospirillales bacterium]MDP6883401.1 cytochrome c3 family protein [Rhodospirillales bacterium]